MQTDRVSSSARTYARIHDAFFDLRTKVCLSVSLRRRHLVSQSVLGLACCSLDMGLRKKLYIAGVDDMEMGRKSGPLKR